MILLPGGDGQPIRLLSMAHCESHRRLQIAIHRACGPVPGKVPVPALYRGGKQNLADSIGNDGADMDHLNLQNETRK